MSLSKKIDEYLEADFAQFHSPAHAGYLGKRDLSEVGDLDDLQDPKGVLKEAQDFVANLFSASKAFFLVNGASIGLQAACLALAILLRQKDEKRPVLIARNVHKSVIAGLVISGLELEFFDPLWNEELGIFTAIDFSSLRPENYSALILTNPSYEGFFTKLPDLELPVIVDEAHGAHYNFSDSLPHTAMEMGADIAIQSWHKTLGSMTQTGVALINHSSKIPAELFQRALKLLQTTSPSYVLLESITKTADKYSSHGKQLIQDTLERARKVNPDSINDDPTRFLINIPGYTGTEIDELLEANGVAVEEVLSNHVLASINPGIKDKDIDKLIQALKQFEQREADLITTTKPESIEEKQNFREKFLAGDDFIAPCPPGIVQSLVRAEV